MSNEELLMPGNCRGIVFCDMDRYRMSILAIGSFLLGAVFGRFFSVWVLFPASALVFAVGYANFSIFEFVVLLICLQVGYASGLALCLMPDLWRRDKSPHEPSRQADSAAPASFLKARHH
jgi:hypothetical protein